MQYVRFTVAGLLIPLGLLLSVAAAGLWAGCDGRSLMGGGGGGDGLEDGALFGDDVAMPDVGLHDRMDGGDGAHDTGYVEDDWGGWEPEVLENCTPAQEWGNPPQGPVKLLFDEDWAGNPEDFWRRPFPDDSRLGGGDGGAGMWAGSYSPYRGFPNPAHSYMLDAFLTIAAGEFAGWSKNGTIYMTFNGPLATVTLPEDPGATVQPEATVYLQDVDSHSPDRGARIPIHIRYYPAESLFVPAYTVAIRPVEGMVLRDGGLYAAVVTTGVGDGWCRPLRSTVGRVTMEARTRELLRVEPGSIAGVALLSTQDVVGPVRRLRQSVRALERPAMNVDGSQSVHGVRQTLTGTVSFPVYQDGTPPYLVAGGRINWGSDGMPIVQRREDVRVSISVPEPGGETRLSQPEDGWPVVIYGHGTGGDSLSCIRDGIADYLCGGGFAVLCYDQVLHGSRDPTGSDPANTFFNYINIVAGRDNVRQGAVDGFLLSHFIGDGHVSLAGDLVPPGSDTADLFKFDPASLFMLGHSQGGITGVPFASVEEGVAAAVYNGTGGGMMIAIMERKDPVDIRLALEQAVGLPPGEMLDYFHPLLTLVQTFLDPADPVNYAPLIVSSSEENGGGRINRQHVLMFEGLQDPFTPPLSVESLAVAFGLEQIMPVEHPIEALALLGRAPIEGPVQGNLDGGARTGGLIQYGSQGHFSIFRSGECDASQVMLRFLKSAVTAKDGVPVIERFSM